MDKILYSLADYKILAMVAGLLIVGLETFIPIIPVLAIVVANAFILGMWLGFLVSWVGSAIASILLYYLANRFSQSNLFERYKNEQKTQKIIMWIQKQGFNTIFISYSCPFIPDFLITITSGFTSLDIKTFISGMVCGKFVMFLLVSYVGEDIVSFFSNPTKIVVLIVAILLSWIVGQNVNKKIHKE
ncbi:MAG: VTT domain-containing protein [Romboutsia sp.]